MNDDERDNEYFTRVRARNQRYRLLGRVPPSTNIDDDGEMLEEEICPKCKLPRDKKEEDNLI